MPQRVCNIKDAVLTKPIWYFSACFEYLVHYFTHLSHHNTSHWTGDSCYWAIGQYWVEYYRIRNRMSWVVIGWSVSWPKLLTVAVLIVDVSCTSNSPFIARAKLIRFDRSWADSTNRNTKFTQRRLPNLVLHTLCSCTKSIKQKSCHLGGVGKGRQKLLGQIYPQ